MNAAVIGATGKTGQRVTAELLERGHHVTAVVRNPSKVRGHTNVSVVISPWRSMRSRPSTSWRSRRTVASASPSAINSFSKNRGARQSWGDACTVQIASKEESDYVAQHFDFAETEPSGRLW
jgi:cation diffusion facilitator CzcD-associated flavoprotein CzcO